MTHSLLRPIVLIFEGKLIIINQVLRIIQIAVKSNNNPYIINSYPLHAY